MKTKTRNHKKVLIVSSLLLTALLLGGCKPVEKPIPKAVPTTTAIPTAQVPAGNPNQNSNAPEFNTAQLGSLNPLPDLKDLPKDITTLLGSQNQPSGLTPMVGSQNTSLTAADQEYFSAALQRSDKSLCEKIQTPEGKSLCVDQISDKALMDDAIASSDKNKCSAMKIASNKELCMAKLDIVASDQAITDQFIKDSAKVDAIVEAGVFSRCAAELTNENVISACQINIAVHQAQEKNDITRCDQVDKQESRDECRKAFQGQLLPPL